MNCKQCTTASATLRLTDGSGMCAACYRGLPDPPEAMVIWHPKVLVKKEIHPRLRPYVRWDENNFLYFCQRLTAEESELARGLNIKTQEEAKQYRDEQARRQAEPDRPEVFAGSSDRDPEDAPDVPVDCG